MKISIVGCGYVGLVTGACLAEVGNDVMCVDIDAARASALALGSIPIYEPGLDDIVRRNLASGRLRFTADPDVATAHGLIQMIAVGTPPDEDGSADLKYVLAAARAIGRGMDSYRLVVVKSTVPVGSCQRVHAALSEALAERGVQIPFDCASNPEFLKEGSAVEDFMRPDRIVVGVHPAADADRALGLLRQLYEPFQRNRSRLYEMDAASSELTKYAANAMLATRISFMNELALLAEQCGADIERVRQGIGSDPRIGTAFLYPGIGYGGSCFPKDVQALLRTGSALGLTLQVVDAVERANERQKRLLGQWVLSAFGPDLRGRRFAFWGAAFKPETDDIREAPSLETARTLAGAGARIRLYDPVASGNFMARLRDEGLAGSVERCDDAYEALQGADALLIHTEWKEFRSPDFDRIRAALATPTILDGRNLFDPARMRELGIAYRCVGRAGAAA